MGAMVNDRVSGKFEERLNVLYLKIGRLYYTKNYDGKITDEEMKDLFGQVEQVKTEKRNLEIKYLAQQGKKKCMACDHIVTLESRFCNMCGEKFDEKSMSIPVDEPEEPAQPVPRKCEFCGEELEADAVFCQNCGKKNEEATQ